MGIAAGRVTWVPLWHGDCCWACRVGVAVPWGLLLGVSWVRRCAMGIAAGRVAGAALCHGDCWLARRVGAAVPCGLLVGVSRGCRSVMGIAGRVACVALCHGDCYWACRVGGAVLRNAAGRVASWGLLTKASSGWRRVFGIADQGVVWVALCHGDIWWGAVSCGLLTRASSGWRRVLGIADQSLVAVLVRGVLASQNGSF